MSQTNTNTAEATAAVAEATAAAVPMPTVEKSSAKSSWWGTAAKVVGYGALAAAVIGGAAYAYSKYAGGNGGEPSEG